LSPEKTIEKNSSGVMETTTPNLINNNISTIKQSSEPNKAITLRTNSILKQESFKKNNVITSNFSNEIEYEKPKIKNLNHEVCDSPNNFGKKVISTENSEKEDRIIDLKCNDSMISERKSIEINIPNEISKNDINENNIIKKQTSLKRGSELKNPNINKSEKDKKPDPNNKSKEKKELNKEPSIESQDKVVRRRQSKYASMLSRDIVVDDDMNDLLNRGISEITKNAMLARNKCIINKN